MIGCFDWGGPYQAAVAYNVLDDETKRYCTHVDHKKPTTFNWPISFGVSYKECTYIYKMGNLTITLALGRVDDIFHGDEDNDPTIDSTFMVGILYELNGKIIKRKETIPQHRGGHGEDMIASFFNTISKISESGL